MILHIKEIHGQAQLSWSRRGPERDESAAPWIHWLIIVDYNKEKSAAAHREPKTRWYYKSNHFYWLLDLQANDKRQFLLYSCQGSKQGQLYLWKSVMCMYSLLHHLMIPINSKDNSVTAALSILQWKTLTSKEEPCQWAYMHA